jgi:ubiquinone/menaquinone biosynthesis C-methylase UbiE
VSREGDDRSTADYWHRDDLVAVVLAALEASGKDLANISVDELAATDQFHGGGRPATLRLAELAGLRDPTRAPRRLLDVGGGLGGPARTLAAEFQCDVTSVDITPSYIDAARALTDLVGLGDRVTHQVGDALDLPFEDGRFDVVWTQNSGMNIADKHTLYAGFHRVLRPGGVLTFQEPLAGEVSPPHVPLMWSDDGTMSFLAAPSELRAAICALGFDEVEWQLVTESTSSATSPAPAHSVQMLIMGPDRLAAIQAASRRNIEEHRVVTVHAVFTKH